MNVNFKPATTIEGDPHFNNVSLLLHMDGTNGSEVFLDSSPLNKTISAFFGPTISAGVKKFGTGAGSFNGTNQYLIMSHDGFDFGTGDFTVEFWAYKTSGGTNGFVRFFISSTQWSIELGDGPGRTKWVNTGEILFADGIPQNQWVHVAFARHNGTLRVFFNGVQQSSVTDNFNYTLNGSGAILGQWNEDFYYPGYVDDFRITKGIARYTGNFTPPTAAFPDASSGKSLRFLKSNDGKKTLLRPVNLPTVSVDPYINNVSLLLHMDGANESTNFIDSSVNNFQFTAFGNAQISTATKKFGNGAGFFNKTLSSSIKTSNNSLLSMGTQDFTVEAWIFPFDAGTDNNGTVIGGKNNNSFQIGYKSSTEFGVASSFSAWDLFSTTLPPINEWTHIAVTRSGNTMRLFYNGILITQVTNTTNYLGFTNEAGGYDDYGGHFNGYIDELRITKGVARYTSNFTPLTTAFPNP